MYSCMSSGGLELTFMICHMESRRTDFNSLSMNDGISGRDRSLFFVVNNFCQACHLPQLTTKHGVCYIQCQHAFSTDA